MALGGIFELERILATVLKKNNKKLFLTLLSILLIMGVLSIYSWVTPRTTTLELEDTIPRMETTFAYKAIVKPNALHPKGGTVEAGDTLYKNVTTAIPFDLFAVIRSKDDMVVNGTFNVQLRIKAGDEWSRTFPLKNNQLFDYKGKTIPIIDSSYQIDLAQVKAFILQVEKETGVRHSQYELEVVPTIQGNVEYADIVRDFDFQDTLKFNYLSEEIKLASEKSFSSAIHPNGSQIVMNPFNLLGFSLPLLPVRITSTSLFLLLLLSILFSFNYLKEETITSDKSEAVRFNKKYRKRVIRIFQQIDVEGKTIVPFASFSSMLKIADYIEQPILYYENAIDHSGMYLIVDVVCVYTFVPSMEVSPSIPIKDTGSGKAYVVG